jgi:beta-1,2-mannooligosaccharide synthase
VGCIAHYSYNGKDDKDRPISVYLNYSFVLDPVTKEAELERIIGTRSCYPDYAVKADKLIDCAFSSGIVMREDGKCDLYSGLGDTCEGRITIDYSFEGCGDIVDTLTF